jgi:hypothetical protein
MCELGFSTFVENVEIKASDECWVRQSYNEKV